MAADCAQAQPPSAAEPCSKGSSSGSQLAIVLDIDGTLIDSNSNCDIFRRPGVDEFLDALFARGPVAIWTHAGEPAKSGSVLALLRNPQFVLHALCYSLLGGISFAIPAVQDIIFGSCAAPTNSTNATNASAAALGSWGAAPAGQLRAHAYEAGGGFGAHGGAVGALSGGVLLPSGSLGANGFSFDATETMWTNFAFVVSGVVTGLLLGVFARDARRYGLILRTMAFVAALAFSALAALGQPQLSSQLERSTVYSFLLLLMAAAGAASLGFIGIALRTACEVGAPVGEVYVGGTVERFIQGWGALLTQVHTSPTRPRSRALPRSRLSPHTDSSTRPLLPRFPTAISGSPPAPPRRGPSPSCSASLVSRAGGTAPRSRRTCWRGARDEGGNRACDGWRGLGASGGVGAV